MRQALGTQKLLCTRFIVTKFTPILSVEHISPIATKSALDKLVLVTTYTELMKNQLIRFDAIESRKTQLTACQLSERKLKCHLQFVVIKSVLRHDT